VNVTVAICTWNRADLLDRTLAQMRNLRIPDGVSWELLVVNNNCTDGTDAVIAGHAGALPLRRLAEPKPGLSNARNCALAHATGELIIWTDDDVLVDPEWLAEYVKAAAANPDAAYFGGTIEPWFEAPPPRWVRDNLTDLQGVLVIRSLGAEVRPFEGDENPFGANMAFRTAVQVRHPYDPQFGRVGGRLVQGEESDLIRRLRREGHFGVWVGTAKVRHYIPQKRTTPAFVRDWFRGNGLSDARAGVFDSHAPTLFGAPRWAWRLYLTYRLKAAVLSPFKNRAWFRALRQSAVLRGVIDEARAARSAVGRVAPSTGVNR
jgi:glycosyltransferase involved in cell wall biosynthesis